MYNFKLSIKKLVSKLPFFSGKAHIKVLSYLVFSTILGHILSFLLFKYTDGSIWVYSNNKFSATSLFRLDLDGGYFEHFQYILLFWCSFLAFYLFFIKSKKLFPIATIYAFFFIDNTLSLHDKIMNQTINPILNKTFLINQNFLRIKDFSEISYWFIFLVLALFISKPFYEKGTKIERDFMNKNYKYFFLLAFFAGFIDKIKYNIISWFSFLNIKNIIVYYLKNLFYLTEEIGEITVISFAFIFLFNSTCEALNSLPKIKN